MTDIQSLRQQIEERLARQNYRQAYAYLTELWQARSTPAMASYVLNQVAVLRNHLPLVPCRLAILRSFTVEPLAPMLQASAFAAGIDLTAQVGDFNTYAQEILDPDSRLYQFAPDVAILCIQTRDIAPDLWDSFTSLSENKINAAVSRVADTFDELVAQFRRNSQAHLVLHNLELPPTPSQGALDSQITTSQVAAIEQVNQRLRQTVSKHRGVYLLDYDGVVARYGRSRWTDERKWLTMRTPIAANAMVELVNEWLCFLHPITGRVCKALVVDLDNTLWGGVIGEDSIEGIKLGNEYPGAAYLSLQKAILDLYHRGIILAVCSKNNYADVMAVIENHPGMLLRPHHFAALKINWNDKAQNLREIAAELNIGVDALAFLDDSPAERALIRSELPEVTVIELPDDPMSYPQTLRDCAAFERLALSDEDRNRGHYYAEQQQRTESRQSTTSLEDFYRSLAQEIEIAAVNSQTLARVAQLTQKTNQFNLTTRRYSEQQIAEMAVDSSCRVYSARVKDRFGDHGLVGVAIIREADGAWEIDNLLLSCRVIGRTVETAILSFVADEARARGVKQLQGWFLPTKKNIPAKDFYPSHHFQMLDETENGALWEMNLSNLKVTCPEWIKLNVAGGVINSESIAV
ncbi:MAG: HAD-IIIC family phosphatase [Blastocatellia bacterium]